MKRLSLVLVVLFATAFVATLGANLAFVGPIAVGGAGLGAVNTLLTIQNSPSESGCVAWNGGADVVGAGACPPGVTGGDEKTGASQTQTRSIAELGLVNAASIRVVFNAVEPAADGVTVDRLVLRFYARNGAVLYSAPLPAPLVFPVTAPGTGNSGFGFALDAAQASAAQVAAFGDTANRIGLSATVSDSGAGDLDSAGGNETFYVTNITTAQPPPPACPIITVMPPTLPNGTVGTAYSQSITASGGVGAYVFSVASGALPVGLTLTPAGLLAGTPTTFGSSTITIQATDGTGCPGVSAYTIETISAVPTLPQVFTVLLALGLAAAGYVRLRQGVAVTLPVPGLRPESR